MKVSVPCAAALALFPFVSALPAPTPAPGEHNIIKYGLDVNGARALYPRQSGGISIPIIPVEPSSSRSSASSSSSSSEPPARSSSSSSTPPPPSTSDEPSTTQPPRSTPTTTTPTTPPPSVIIRTSTSQTQIASTQENGVVVTITSQVLVSAIETPSATPAPADQQDNSGSSGVSTSTIIGLSVAGGLAALVAIAFVAWKLTRKRFSQFDTDDGVINWPDLRKDPEVTPPRPAPSTTNSTVDLVKDPYAVPPLPQNNGSLGPYRDETGFYDPYRGPIPQTFSTPPASMDGHPQGWVGGEAIPMSTYASGRTSPGPNFAYGGVDPMQRIATPVQRMATPVQRMATPVGGAATFQEIVRGGTPAGVPPPYRTGTPGYGYGGQ